MGSGVYITLKRERSCQRPLGSRGCGSLPASAGKESLYLDVRLGGPPKCRSPARYRSSDLESLFCGAERFTLILMQKRFTFCERGAGRDGYASGGVPVTGALPDFGQNRVPV